MTAVPTSKDRHILAYIRDEDEAELTTRAAREAIRTTSGGEGTLTLLPSVPGPLLASLPTGVIWDLHAASFPPLTAMIRETVDAGRIVPPLLVRVDLSEIGARQLVNLARLVPRLRTSVRGTDEFEDDLIDWLLVSDHPAAGQAIINRLGSFELTPSIQLAIKAAVGAKRRIHVPTFAGLIGVPLRTLEARLRAEGSLNAWQLIGWSLSLHALWRLEVRQWPLKRVAISLGFSGSQALGSRLERHLGARPRALLARHDFESVLDAYLGCLRSRHDGRLSS